jgi:cystathionine beta-lyase/cystathionine gamma-synthase
MQFETRCVHVGVNKDPAYKGVITPIYPTSTFAWDDLTTNRGYDYTRSGNPTRKALEENIASLEGGIDCKATSTGMSAITAAVHLFQPGDHIIAGHDIYGGTYRLFADVYAKWGFRFSFVDMRDLANVRKALTPATKGLWIETPSNPLLNVVDIAALTAIAREANVVTIADNTFLSPYLQRPLELGVDVVVHSTTKYLNGHSDVIGRAVVAAKEKDAEDQQRVDYDDSERFSPAGRGGSEESDDLPCRRSTEWDGGRRSMMITDQHHVPPQITVPCSDFRDK